MEARMLSALLCTALSRQSKLCKNQMMMAARKMMVKALRMKSLAFSHMCRATLLAEGMR